MDDEHEDCDLQNELLEQLAKYGDSLLEKSDTPTPKKAARFKKAPKTPNSVHDKTPVKNAGSEPKQVKKKNHKTTAQKTTDERSNEPIQQAKSELRGELRHVEELKMTLGLTDDEIEKLKVTQKQENDGKFQPQGKNGRPGPKVVVFEDPAKRKKNRKRKPEEPTQEDVNSTKASDDAAATFDFGRARAEVRKFGIQGLETKAKAEATVDLLVSLGAKKPKRQHTNYKDFQEQIKNKKQEELAKREVDRSLGYKVKKADRRRQKGKNDIGYLDGQIGKYKRGIQIISKKDFAPKGNSGKHTKSGKHKK